jgi:hypothetical protein
VLDAGEDIDFARHLWAPVDSSTMTMLNRDAPGTARCAVSTIIRS